MKKTKKMIEEDEKSETSDNWALKKLQSKGDKLLYQRDD